MNRISKIRKHPVYQKSLGKIEVFEEERIYCRHNMEHFLDVARIASILAMEEKLKISREMVYAAALLHDIGRCLEYEQKCSHESGSIVLAFKILPDCGFSEEEIHALAEAIAQHREKGMAAKGTLGEILYRADKLSRPCYQCKASDTCKWEYTKRNHEISY